MNPTTPTPTPRQSPAPGTIAALLLAGATLAVVGGWGFANLADEMVEGSTQAFDTAVLRWIGTLQSDGLTEAMRHITFLADTAVLAATTAGVALLLWFLGKRNHAALLVVTVLGTALITFALKSAFDRPRPPEAGWGVEVSTPSFPSGHASSSLAAFGTITYIAARLQRRRWTRLITIASGVLLILAIAASRMLLGVHYPSDVLAGHLVAIAWMGVCIVLFGGRLRRASSAQTARLNA